MDITFTLGPLLCLWKA